MPGSGVNTFIANEHPDVDDIAEYQTPEAIDKAMEKIIKDVPKQPSSH